MPVPVPMYDTAFAALARNALNLFDVALAVVIVKEMRYQPFP
jgi:hypothetical protein